MKNRIRMVASVVLAMVVSACGTEQAGLTAGEFVNHQTQRMLFMAAGHVSKNEFDGRCKELLRELRKWRDKRGDEPVPEWWLNRRLPWKPRDHEDVRVALVRQKKIHYEETSTGGTPKRLYRLLVH